MTTLSKYVKATFESEYAGKKTDDYDYKKIYKQRLIDFRKETESLIRVKKPTNIPRARELGYKAKKGFIVVRARVRKGSGSHLKSVRARRPKRVGIKKLTRRISIQSIAEKRVNKKYPNCEVLNSYWIAEDGQHKYFEVILVDVSRPEIISDKEINWITKSQHTSRAERGKTSSQKKGRGLKRGRGHEKNYPSQRANRRKAK